jgi:hypothetical protein
MSYDELKEKEFVPLGRFGPKRALKLVKRGILNEKKAKRWRDCRGFHAKETFPNEESALQLSFAHLDAVPRTDHGDLKQRGAPDLIT